MTGVKSIDITIKALGEGIINTNGARPLENPEIDKIDKIVKNHTAPKIRNLNPLLIKKMSDLNGEHDIFVSSNCIRNALFPEAQQVNAVDNNNIEEVLTGFLGLMRGYLATESGSSSAKRKSPLFLSDFVAKTELRFEQFSNARGADANKLWSAHRPVGVCEYTATASISVEDLAFIPLSNTFSRSAYKSVVTQNEIDTLSQKMRITVQNIAARLNALSDSEKQFISLHSDIDTNLISVDSSNNFLRNNPFGDPISQEGEAGLVLNDTAIDVIVWEMLYRLATLNIVKTKGFLRTESINFDFNDGMPMRILRDPIYENKIRQSSYWTYYTSKPVSEETMQEQKQRYEDQQAKRQAKRQVNTGEKNRKGAPAKDKE